MNLMIIVLIVAVVLIILYFYRLRGHKGAENNALYGKNAAEKLRLPSKMANETIERYIKSLKESRPGHTEEWYLEKIIYDLDRDRQ